MAGLWVIPLILGLTIWVLVPVIRREKNEIVDLDLGSQKDQLVAEIAELEEDLADGRIGEADYQETRARKVAALASLLKEEGVHTDS